MSVKYPQVKVKLVGEDGNAFSIMGQAAQAARQAGLSKDAIAAYREEAMSGDYNHLLVTTMEWFDCDSEDDEEEDEWYDEDCDDYYDDPYDDEWEEEYDPTGERF